MIRAAALCLALFAAAPASAQPAQAATTPFVETRTLVLAHDGRERSAIMDAAPDLRDAPVLVALHGGIGSAGYIRRRAGVTLARRGWVVLWPEAVDDWSDGRVDASGRPFSEVDDVGFLRALIEALAAEGTVDPDRVFFAGPSIGGMMTLRMLCEAPDLVAGAAIAIAAAPIGLDCPDGPPRPVLYLHGTADAIVPEEGGRIAGSFLLARDRGSAEPVADTLARLAARNRCDGFAETALPDRVADDGSRVLRRDYLGCAAPLRHFVVEGGGHSWPGMRRSAMGEALIGATNQDISATAEIERFFAEIAAQGG
ncbi:MAG: alpha/beta hydrolase family esterase [Rubrimonas sp.]|uniref:alpha/beta hydrolase family esterase n=1 Tax=Rubrimonas sp. TaxID=2036015 RepID=UPI002FDD8EBC